MPPLSIHRLILALFGLLMALSTTSTSHASGTYPPAPPKLRSDVLRDIDPDAYNLGKSIFIGRANLNAMSPVGAQQAADTRRALDAVIALIPERASEQLDVAALSRALDAASREALIYYLKLRFRVKENTE